MGRETVRENKQKNRLWDRHTNNDRQDVHENPMQKPMFLDKGADPQRSNRGCASHRMLKQNHCSNNGFFNIDIIYASYVDHMLRSYVHVYNTFTEGFRFAERDPVYSVRSASKVRRWPTIETRAHTTIKPWYLRKGQSHTGFTLLTHEEHGKVVAITLLSSRERERDFEQLWTGKIHLTSSTIKSRIKLCRCVDCWRKLAAFRAYGALAIKICNLH